MATTPTTTGDDSRYCGAPKKQGPGNCTRPAGWGTDHVGVGRCKMHLGNSPTHRISGARRLAADRIRRDLDAIEIREIDNPLAELRRLTGEVVAWKDALASHVANLTDAMRYRDDKGGEQLRAEVALYERAMDRAGKFLEMWARLGIDAMLAEMQVKVTEGQVTAMTRGLDAYRLAAGVDDTAHQAGLSAMGKVLRDAR